MTVFGLIYNSENRVGKKKTRSGVFLTNVEVFGNVLKHWPECLYIFSIKT